MAILSDVQTRKNNKTVQWKRVAHEVLLVPEAGILIGFLLILWAFNSPALISFLAVVTAFVFGVRLGLMALAEQQLSQGAYTRANRLTSAALRIHPWSTDALLLHAQALAHQGQDAAALETLRRAAKVDPENDHLQMSPAAALLAHGNAPSGWKVIEPANHIEAGSPDVLQQQAWVAMHVENDPARAIALMSHVQQEHLPPRTRAPLLVALCEAHIKLGTFNKAFKLLRELEQQIEACGRTQQAELLYHLGRLYSASGKDGSNYYRRSVELDPNGRYAHTAWRCAITG